MLSIENLQVAVSGKQVLRGIDLKIKPGEVHAIMGPNGSGKSTLSYTLAGRDGYEITDGKIVYKGDNINDLPTDERARAGVFLAFQYPVEIPGVSAMNFLKNAVNAVREAQGKEPLDAVQFLKTVREKAKALDISDDLLKRAVNSGFSGGEKKRFDILQMAMLEPSFAILDETDSGLDIDALKTVSEGVNALRNKERGMLIITHYQRLLNYIQPDYVHVLVNGKIIESGDASLAQKLEDEGYAAFDAQEGESAA